MTEEQFNHYIKGGKFRARFWAKNPDDLVPQTAVHMGEDVICYQNIVIVPIQEKSYNGDHQFNTDKFPGWIPEVDLQNLEIIEDEFIEHVEPLPQYMYKLHYTDQSKIQENFGKKSGLKVPCSIYRDFSSEHDDYIKRLSKPQADEIYKYIWQGKYQEEIKWERLL